MLNKEEISKYINYDKNTGIFDRIRPLKNQKAYDIGSKDPTNGHIKVSFNGGQYLAQKIAWIMVYGEESNHILKHINGDKTDNRICNIKQLIKGVGITGVDELKEWMEYNPETGVFKWLKTKHYNSKKGSVIGTKQKHGYLGVGLNGKLYRLHRLAFLYMEGRMPEQIDHINHVRDDNRWVNLREVDSVGNGKNLSMSSGNKSGFNGVCWDKFRDKWAAEIRFNGKRLHLGRFTDKSDAIAARKSANIKYNFHENHGG